MMAIETKNISAGFKAPVFRLPDVISGNDKSLDELKGEKASVIMFICNHCPYVKYVINGIVHLAASYYDQPVSFIAINANDAEKYPEDAPDKMKIFAKENKFTFPYLYDESQEVAKNYDAACTPEFYVFDHDLNLRYHGQMDDARPKNHIPVTGKDLKIAIDEIIQGKELSILQKPSIGCSIKWR
ncbi:MAG: thioredoxin family protein [Bacteroidia bacterium]